MPDQTMKPCVEAFSNWMNTPDGYSAPGDVFSFTADKKWLEAAFVAGWQAAKADQAESVTDRPAKLLDQAFDARKRDSNAVDDAKAANLSGLTLCASEEHAQKTPDFVHEKDPRENCPWKCRPDDSRCLCQKWSKPLGEPVCSEIPVKSVFEDEANLKAQISRGRLEQIQAYADEGGLFPNSLAVELLNHIRAIEKVRDEWMMNYVRLRDTPEPVTGKPPVADLSKCPKSKGPADNGHDRCLPPSPYFCSKCSTPQAMESEDTCLSHQE